MIEREHPRRVIPDPSHLAHVKRRAHLVRHVVGGGHEIDAPTALDIFLDGPRGVTRRRHTQRPPIDKRRDGVERIRRVRRDKVHDARYTNAQHADQRHHTGRTGVKVEDGLDGRRGRLNDLDPQCLFFAARLFKGPYRSDPFERVPLGSTCHHTPLCAVPVISNDLFPVLVLIFARRKLIAFDLHKKLGNLERVPGVGVEVEIRLGIERPIEELERIGTRHERVGFGLERAKRERVGKVSGEMAVDVESPCLEVGDGKVDNTAGQSYPKERAGLQARQHTIIDWRTAEQPRVERGNVDVHDGCQGKRWH